MLYVVVIYCVKIEKCSQAFKYMLKYMYKTRLLKFKKWFGTMLLLLIS